MKEVTEVVIYGLSAVILILSAVYIIMYTLMACS